MVELKKILNYRSYVMGFACIMIMIFHANLPLINMNFIKEHLFIGVDIFLFVSGIGIAQSLSKNTNLKDFYKKRLLRILPPTLPIIVFGCLFLYIYDNDFSVTDFYMHSFYLNSFLAKGNLWSTLWYLPTILVYYLISPLIYNYYTKSESKIKSIIVLTVICLMLMAITIPNGCLSHLSFFTNRLLIYVYGIIFGVRIINNDKICTWELLFWILSSLVGITSVYVVSNITIIAGTVFKILSFIPIVIAFVIIFSLLIEYIQKRNKHIKFQFLEKLGKYTLVIYCSHEILQHLIRAVMYHYQININFMYNLYYYELIVGVLTICFAIVWSKSMDFIFYNKK